MHTQKTILNHTICCVVIFNISSVNFLRASATTQFDGTKLYFMFPIFENLLN